jgi:hypothetical protein
MDEHPNPIQQDAVATVLSLPGDSKETSEKNKAK